MVVIYSTSNSGPGERLRQAIETVVPKENTEVYRNMASFSKRLHGPHGGVDVAILLAARTRNLLDLLSLQDLLWDLKIILILPDSNPNTITKGHTLRPRFVSDCNSDFQEVAAVLQRMIGNMDINGY